MSPLVADRLCMQHHFAKEIGTFQQAMRFCCLVQRQAPVNHWLHASQRYEAYERLHILRAPPAYAHDAQRPHKDLPQV